MVADPGPADARARLAFFHLGQVDLELIEPMGEPSTWNDQLVAHGGVQLGAILELLEND